MEIKLDESVTEEEDDFIFEADEPSIRKSQQETTSEMAEKLDCKMQHMFNYLDAQCNNGYVYTSIPGNNLTLLDYSIMILIYFRYLFRNRDAKVQVFDVMLKIFDCAILHTHKSKFTQFLLFYVCRLDQLFVQRFLSYLLTKALDASNHVLTRQICIAYVASFAARANFIHQSVLLSCLQVMKDWAFQYLDQQEADSVIAQPNATTHAVFYSIVQAIFYIFCFKLDKLTELPSSGVSAAHSPSTSSPFLANGHSPSSVSGQSLRSSSSGGGGGSFGSFSGGRSFLHSHYGGGAGGSRGPHHLHHQRPAQVNHAELINQLGLTRLVNNPLNPFKVE